MIKLIIKWNKIIYIREKSMWKAYSFDFYFFHAKCTVSRCGRRKSINRTWAIIMQNWTNDNSDKWPEPKGDGGQTIIDWHIYIILSNDINCRDRSTIELIQNRLINNSWIRRTMDAQCENWMGPRRSFKSPEMFASWMPSFYTGICDKVMYII